MKKRSFRALNYSFQRFLQNNLKIRLESERHPGRRPVAAQQGAGSGLRPPNRKTRSTAFRQARGCTSLTHTTGNQRRPPFCLTFSTRSKTASSPKDVPNRLETTPSTAFSETKLVCGKDRERYALNLTVFRFAYRALPRRCDHADFCARLRRGLLALR